MFPPLVFVLTFPISSSGTYISQIKQITLSRKFILIISLNLLLYKHLIFPFMVTGNFKTFGHLHTSHRSWFKQAEQISHYFPYSQFFSKLFLIISLLSQSTWLVIFCTVSIRSPNISIAFRMPQCFNLSDAVLFGKSLFFPKTGKYTVIYHTLT